MTNPAKETRFAERLKFIKFEERLKEAMASSKRELNFDFPVLKDLIRTEGGVMAAKRLLFPKDKFSEGFKRLLDAERPSYTLEAVVLEFKDSGLFTDTEIEIAQWRLANYEKAEG